MIRLAVVIFLLTVFPNGSLADPDCLESEELASTCGAYCFSAMKPVMGYVKANQHQLETCAKGTGPDLRQINNQITDVKKTLDKVIKSLESRETNRSEGENLLQRLGKIENHLKAVLEEKASLQNQLNKIQNALSLKARIAKHGDKMYIFDDRNSTPSCNEMGGKLASIEWINENVELRRCWKS